MTANVRFADVKDRIVNLLAQSKRLTGFLVPQGIKDEIVRAAEEFAAGKESEAVSLELFAENSLKNMIVAFFKGSPKFFQRTLETFQLDLDKDLLEKLQKEFGKLEREAKLQIELDTAHCADCYAYAFSMFEWAEAEQATRGQIRRVNEERARQAKEAAEQSRREAQRAQQREQARQQRQQVADELLAAIT